MKPVVADKHPTKRGVLDTTLNCYLLTMLTWNSRDSTPLSAAPRAPKGDQGWIFWSYKSLSGLPESGPYRIFVLVFNWNHFEMRLLNLRINFYLLRTFYPHLGSFCVVSSFTTFRSNFTSGPLQVIYCDLG